MKHILLPLATTTTLLLLLSSTTNGDDTVYDVLGNELVAGGTIYIIPNAYNAVGGGFYWKQNNNENYIYQVEDKLDFGLPIAFYPVDASQNTITLSSEINIAFPEANPPSTSNVWKVDDNKQVLLGGTKGGFDGKSVFKLKELDSGGYSINYCTNATSCGGLGIDPFFNVTGVRKLIVNGTDPLPINFEPKPLFPNKYSIFAAA